MLGEILFVSVIEKSFVDRANIGLMASDTLDGVPIFLPDIIILSVIYRCPLRQVLLYNECIT